MTSNLRKIVLVVLVFALSLTLTNVSYAQENPPPQPITDDDVNEVSKELYCPVCENVPLDVCGTQACADWRAEIRIMLEDGYTQEQIEAQFAERYGKRVIANPDASGIDLLLWLVPPLAIIGGLGVLVFTLRRMAPNALKETLAPEAALRYEGIDPEYVQRVNDEVRLMGG